MLDSFPNIEFLYPHNLSLRKSGASDSLALSQKTGVDHLAKTGCKKNARADRIAPKAQLLKEALFLFNPA